MFLVGALPDGDTAVLAGSEGRHAATVRRIGAGERVSLTDGAGGVALCTVTAVRGGTLEVAVRDRRHEPPPSPRLVVVQALAKGDRAELAVELMTELGVDGVVPWASARSVAQWRGERGDKALERWRSTAREAAKQSRRARLPEVSPLCDTAGVVARAASASAAFVLHEAATDALASVDLPASGDVVLIVGPEGGISSEELGAFSAAGALPCRLGSPVLRTSTAGAAALAALSVRLGRWS